MKTFYQSNKKIIKFLLVIILMACLAISTIGFVKTLAQEPTLSGVELLDKYTVGTEIEIPDGLITVEDTEITAQPTVYFPDGIATARRELSLNQVGKYKVEYVAQHNGKTYSFTKEFQVFDYLFVYSSTNQPLKYQHNDDYNADGVQFSIKPNEKVIYKKIIDFSNISKNDSIALIDATPSTPGEPEARDLILTLTDVYNENNYVNIRIRRAPSSEDQNYSYVTASHNGNPWTGWSGSTLFQNHSNYGTGLYNGLQGNWEDTYHIDIRFDYEEKSLYVYDPEARRFKLITNLVDDFGENAWSGFTTGEAILSIRADTYATSNIMLPFNGIVLDVIGSDISEGISEDGTVGVYESDVVCTPVVDFGEYESYSGIPNAMVGYEYKIFNASINTLYGNERLTTRVYYGYNTSTQYECAVINGAFTPSIEGCYTIVYEVTDVFGNSARSCVDVYAYGAEKNQMYDITVPGYNSYLNGKVGEEYQFVSADKVIITGNYGKATLKITATHMESKEVIDITDGNFIPKKAGLWEITYISTDYINRFGFFSYKANIIVGDEVIFGEVEDFFPYFIVNGENPISKLYYVDYNQGEQSKLVEKIYIEKGGNKVADVANGYFKPTEAGDYVIVYEVVSSKGVTCYKKLPVTAVDVGFKDLENFDIVKYFYSNDIVSREEGTKSVSFVIKENGVADFIRPIDAVNFEFSFNVGEDINVARKVTVTLVDLNNPNQLIKLSFKNNSGAVSLGINDRKDYSLANYKFGGGADFSFRINNGILTIGSNKIQINDYLDGSKYEGFSSLLAKMSIKVEVDEGVTGNTEIIVKRVGNQAFYDIKAVNVSSLDECLPSIVLSSSFKERILIGSTLKIGYSKAIDVIDPYSKATLSVLDSSGSPIKDINGVLLKDVEITSDYYVRPEKTGTYYVSYQNADSSNSLNKPTRMVFRIISHEKPIITIKEGDTTGKVNEAFEIGSATYESASSKVDLRIFVLGPVGNMKAVDMNTMTYVPTQKGTYRVIYMALDEWGNMATEEVLVKVS